MVCGENSSLNNSSRSIIKRLNSLWSYKDDSTKQFITGDLTLLALSVSKLIFIQYESEIQWGFNSGACDCRHIAGLGTFENCFINPQVNLQGQLHKPTPLRREASIDAARPNKVITLLVKPSLTRAINRALQIRARQSNHFSPLFAALIEESWNYLLVNRKTFMITLVTYSHFPGVHEIGISEPAKQAGIVACLLNRVINWCLLWKVSSFFPFPPPWRFGSTGNCTSHSLPKLDKGLLVKIHKDASRSAPRGQVSPPCLCLDKIWQQKSMFKARNTSQWPCGHPVVKFSLRLNDLSVFEATSRGQRWGQETFNSGLPV